MNPWQTWLQSLSQQQNSSSANAEAFNAQWNAQWNTHWQSACQQWQKSMEGLWESPSAYWQTVSSIQSARARTIASFWQQQPGYFTALFQCKSFPQLVELCTRWSGHNLTALINLNVVTQAQRSNLLSQWQRQLPFLSATSPAALASMWKFSFPQQSSAQSSQQSKPATSNIVTPAFKAPQASTSTPVSASTSVTPQPAATSATVTSHPAQPQPATASSAQTQTSLNLSTPHISESSTSLTSTDTTPIISSTATSVMRSSTGSTIAAAAAARRSVVARRSSNNRRRAVR